ncbi:MAG TPA: hypothetical protein VJ124_02955 [Pyrinomonadaceae bacterium]|nr:hypothetical protein [Pyrinomonadaceae bacterium]
MEKKTINLRDLPEDFVRQAKAYAALSGLSLKDFVLQAVQAAMQKEIQPKFAGAMFARSPKKRSGR